jgi:predicted transcriptional regulator
MELHFPPETEAKLNELAQRTRRGTDELLREAVDHLVTYNDWFERKVKNSTAAVERGEVVPDEEVRSWLEHQEQRGCESNGRPTQYPT